MAPRYALYFMPRTDTPLGRFGSSVIGYDAWSGQSVSCTELTPYRAVQPSLTQEPARYGFHATLKAPFHLREGVSGDDLQALAAEFAAKHGELPIGPLMVRSLSHFLALVPVAPPKSLNALAANCVSYFDCLRAPLTEADRQRRLKSHLNERQMRYLEAWGYPYVLDEFRFHMTLTGPLVPEQQAPLLALLEGLWARVSARIVIDGLTIAMQPNREAPFRAVAHYPFQPKLSG